MAGNSFNLSNAGQNPFDIYNDARPTLQQTAPTLPNGCCNFVDLTPGANGAKCGCRRFWPRQAMGSPVTDQAGWCMCAHHACYHDDTPRDGYQNQPEPQAIAHQGGQENERPHTVREPLTPIADTSMQNTSAVPGLDFSAFSPGVPLSFIHDLPTDADGTCILDASPYPPGSMPDTLAWGEYIQSPTGPSGRCEAAGLPHIPSQLLMPSQTASTTSSIQAKYERPFAGKGLNTLNVKPSDPVTSHPPQHQHRDRDFPGSPSHNVDPANGSFGFVGPDGQAADTPPSGIATQTEPRTSVVKHRRGASREMLRNLSDTICGHEQRLDQLETVSFSANGHEECFDKHDHMDLRVTDLEQRMEGVEKAAEGAHPAHTQRDAEDDGSASVTSTGTSLASRVSTSAIMSQISSLQARVTHLQTFLPSQSHAWTVEVVFLPFPLTRLWQDISQFKAEPTASHDEWTQMPMTLSNATMRSQSPFNGNWAAADADLHAEWLYPRACGDKSTQDKRLRSRGLIQAVPFRGPDARSVQLAIHEAFGPVFRSLGITAHQGPSDDRLSRYLGLQEAWVPLRKIHKDSRLRFLSAAEMLTPTTWDVNFLHSIAMKAVEPRLFITHPDAYVQDYRAYESGWTWQHIRDMDPVTPDVTESQEVKEADAMEHCWHWNEQLDGSTNAPTTLDMQRKRQRGSSSSPFVLAGSEHSCRSVSPFAVRGPSPMLAGRRAQRPPHIRTASVPVVPPVRPSPASAGRRRIVSHGQSRQSSPFARGTSQSGVQKRPARSMRSPCYPRQTPRWTSSPSPMPSGVTDRHFPRGLTPLAYATPFSNAPLQELRPVRGSSVARSTTDHMAGEYTRDELFDIEIYESESDESYDDDRNHGGDNYSDDNESISSDEMLTHAHADAHADAHAHAILENDSQPRQLPEDEPWPGIEDQDHGSVGENMDPQQHVSPDDRHSIASSQPSEYPTTERTWPVDSQNGTGFHIHEDRHE
ncbi:hypothetical protein QQS21_004157 [Conoideocrella luteorostrata]|uniref:Uncharacterized protein n=1 Tax=Conoideocrella luteorostrata TaxID=1105319 RepID=A0AAJ0CS37_9HYPO|nr:hypothetical protein QQS21_004157 [Conoideocrella luteorostrata]